MTAKAAYSYGTMDGMLTSVTNDVNHVLMIIDNVDPEWVRKILTETADRLESMRALMDQVWEELKDD